MQNFTEHGQSVINNLSSRYGISADAVICMLNAVNNGHGSMAQFNCPELGGGGQWMQGGMTMVGDMFNYSLKSTVDNLCTELSNALANGGLPIYEPIVYKSDVTGESFSNWWKADLGIASSTGGQNDSQYAVFPATQRLAVSINGQVSIYDTLDHQIGGVSQQQGGNDSMTFSSQYGTIFVSQLPLISIDGHLQPLQQPVQQSVAAPVEFIPEPVFPPSANQNEFAQNAEDDIFNKIGRLAQLNENGALTDDEFSAKKAELLQRL